MTEYDKGFQAGLEMAAKMADLLDADNYDVTIAEYNAWIKGTFDAASAIRALANQTPCSAEEKD